MEMKETKEKGEGKRKKKKPRKFCIKFVAFNKRHQSCKDRSEESWRRQGFGSKWITKLRQAGADWKFL